MTQDQRKHHEAPITGMVVCLKAILGYILLMEEILHQLICSLSQYLCTGFYTSQVVQDFFPSTVEWHSIWLWVFIICKSLEVSLVLRWILWETSIVNDMIDGSEIRLTSWYAEYPIIYRGFIDNRWLAGYFPSTVWHLFEWLSKICTLQMWSLRPGETYEKMVLPVLSPDPNTDETWRMLGCWRCVHQSNNFLDQLIADFDAWLLPSLKLIIYIYI